MKRKWLSNQPVSDPFAEAVNNSPELNCGATKFYDCLVFYRALPVREENHDRSSTHCMQLCRSGL